MRHSKYGKYMVKYGGRKRKSVYNKKHTWYHIFPPSRQTDRQTDTNGHGTGVVFLTLRKKTSLASLARNYS
jgi:hypothetical protein